MDLSVGFTFDKYCIIRKIAEGGFAAVYEAEDINLSRHVAIKLMLRQASSKEKAIFLQEAKIIANLEHAHIIQIFDFGFLPDGRIYIVMPLVKTNLRERVKKQGPFSLEEVLHSVVPIAEALHHAHTSPWQLVHRDVKPENVLISNRDEILLSDFGISVGTTTGKAVVEESIGTLHSMSPEQFNGKPVRATDQYALGILTYQLFCGKLPFTGNFTHQHAWLGYAALHRQQPVPPFAEKGGKENWEVEAVIQRALAKEPEDRYPTIRDFVGALEDIRTKRIRQAQEAKEQKEREEKSKLQEELLYARQQIQQQQELLEEKQRQQQELQRQLDTKQQDIEALEKQNTALEQQLATRPHVLSYLPVMIYTEHKSAVWSVAWSPDGTSIASASRDKSMHVIDARTGKLRFTYTGHKDAVYSVAWSPNGTNIASASMNHSVHVIDAHAGKLRFAYTRHKDAVWSVAWSPDSTGIASASRDKSVHVIDARTGKLRFAYTGHKDAVWSVAWSPDGTSIASASRDKSVHVIDARTGKLRFAYTGHKSTVWSVAWSPDSTSIASASASVHVIDAYIGEQLLAYTEHKGSVLSVAWSPWLPDGTSIASASADNTVHVIDANTGKNLFVYAGHNDAVWSVAWSPDGTKLATGSDDHTVHIWQAPEK